MTGKPIPWWFTPPVLIFGPVLLSLSSWAAVVLSEAPKRYSPTVSTKLLGFDTPAQVTLPGVVLLATFYCALAWIAMLGWELGAKPGRGGAPGGGCAPVISERRYFLALLGIATVGVGYCYAVVASRQSVLGALSAQVGNQLYDSLSQGAGVQTLRYATILAAPIGIYLWRRRVIPMFLMIAAVVLLGLNALLSSRLSLLMAACVYLAIWVRTREPAGGATPRRHYLRTVLATVAVGFVVLTALNYTRNANFYRQWGVSNPFAMNAYQTAQYVSVPAQVSLGVADFVMTGKWHVPSSPGTSLEAITPTFLQKHKVKKAEKKKFSADYGYSMTFAPQYFTNSVFADTYAEYGAWGWAYTFLLYGAAGYLLARFMRAEPVVAATGGVLAYCFAEVWRIQILTYGIVIFLVLLTVVLSWLAQAKEPTGDPPGSGSGATGEARRAKAHGRTA